MSKPSPQIYPHPVLVTILSAVDGHPELIVGQPTWIDPDLATTLIANGQAVMGVVDGSG